jgi:DnaJ family protein A protein 2
LFFKKKILLIEALTGTTFVITHLDGKKITVQSKPGEIIKPGDSKQLTGKGMPFHKDPMSHGNLYIVFEIEFPKKGDLKNVEDLKKLLPAV